MSAQQVPEKPAVPGVMTTPSLDSQEPTWGVGAVADRLEIAASTLRTWERRYRIGPSHRTEGGHRRYTENDIERVQLVQLLVEQGMSAQDAARVALGSVDAGAQVVDDVLARRPDTGDAIGSVVAAAEHLDADRLSRVYAGVLQQRGVPVALHEVVGPALRDLHRRCEDGELHAEAFHLAEDRLVVELHAIVRTRRATTTRADGIVVGALASGDEDVPSSLPMIGLEASLAEAGWGAYVMSPRLPVAGMRRVVDSLQPDVLFLWAGGEPCPDAGVVADLVREPWPCRLVLVGPGWTSEVAGSLPCDVQRAPDLVRAVELLPSGA